MSGTLAGFSRQCDRFPAELDKARKAGALKVAQGMTDAARRNTRRIATSGKLSGVGRSGTRVDVRYDAAPSGDYLVHAVGPYQLIERDTHGHRIPRARGRRARVLHIPGVGYRRSVHHPGTKGKHPFERAVREFEGKAAPIVQREVRAAADRMFR
jgi:hypothetical protein